MPASAQWAELEGRFTVHIDGGYQALSKQSKENLAQRAYGEEAQLTAKSTFSQGPFLDAGALFRVWRQVGVGASYSHGSRSGMTTVTGIVPHPILFGSGRSVAVEIQARHHTQRAIHFHMTWNFDVIPMEKLDLTLYGGPSIFRVTHGVVTGFVINEPSGPPFPDVGIDQIIRDEHTRNGFGGHVGVDLAYMWTPQVGFGVFARFTAGSTEVPSPSGPIAVSLGGLQSAAGLRVRF